MCLVDFDVLFFQIVSIITAAIAFGAAFFLYRWVKGQPSSNQKIAAIGQLIRKGAFTFLRKEYKTLSRFCAVAAIIIFLFLPSPIWEGNVLSNLLMAVSYVFGTVFSGIAGYVGISIATIANIKSAEASTKGIKPSFMSGFRGGAVMGMAVVGASLLGVTLVLLLTDNTTALLGFSFGASSLALFAKAGGGIFTKTADISADLVGKVELGIPEDDPRNPAVIADNVGDNVGDVAGMGADLFDSNVASMAAALVMASALDKASGGHLNASMVFCYASIGLFASIIGVLTAKMDKKGNPTRALNSNTYVTTVIFGVLTALATYIFNFKWEIWFASTIGLIVGVVIGIASDYFTDDRRKPVHQVAKASESGPAFTILSGISYGLMSTLPSMVGIGISAVAAYKICEPLGDGYAMFGISMAAVGMLSIVGMIISNDAYGPIVDNARGLVEMGDLGEEALEITDSLDSAGNTVKAVTKGFAIGAAGLTVISLLGAFISEVNVAAVKLGKPLIEGFDVINPLVFFGLLVGAAIPALFSSMLMLGVNRNAQRMVSEIHRQFEEIDGLKEGREGVTPEYDKCIEIATKGAIRELIPAGLMTIIATLLVGLIGGVYAIGGFITGNIVSGLIFALFMSNSGGLWDNTKKYVEAGNHGGKNSIAHKAAVVGDTVGDPFKDTAGPSINTQITVVSLIASLTASIFLAFSFFG
ncbi:MAG TPA: sodium-translocating pyrophosphatase [Lachnoclostridium phytofermentans]|uniref:K(+)-insensitive pyrophosphate-energized proton pump n=1 Tax=Lachnoclostridium phytofermentans TaxID=66219 RepID=A0A3D2X6Y0_9FIRM|nr:sodium-translocating pyrophosphatase [Lachnoclostridium phytofermentans]